MSLAPERQIADELAARHAVKRKDGDFAYYEISRPQNFLECAATKDFVFHGTSRRIEGNLKPYKANDMLKESGNREAVYMTRNPLLAEFTALTGGVDVGRRQNSCNMAIENGVVSYPGEQRFGVENVDKVQNEGFVYIFDRKTQTDTEENGELMSYREIRPLAVIKIKRGDFGYQIDKIQGV